MWRGEIEIYEYSFLYIRGCEKFFMISEWLQRDEKETRRNEKIITNLVGKKHKKIYSYKIFIFIVLLGVKGEVKQADKLWFLILYKMEMSPLPWAKLKKERERKKSFVTCKNCHNQKCQMNISYSFKYKAFKLKKKFKKII